MWDGNLDDLFCQNVSELKREPLLSNRGSREAISERGDSTHSRSASLDLLVNLTSVVPLLSESEEVVAGKSSPHLDKSTCSGAITVCGISFVLSRILLRKQVY